ncbi:hypothetical protein CKO15_13080 [Halorhodospira abdelmalekii]|uniref:DUF6998 domain-containing protein n=1 Tax=Halorhodospira abdelmalekii TaxID=421629 RepID=UPI001908E029|nr:hypothetical protein [Halorhodospira abdelmalekii]MBK1736185.1 hypothetical protein [Halorhodospira abdelmalekii]
MALTQMQLIQSLGEAMSWFERELSWGVPPTELWHLCGRIGELYAALITNGQMATEVNQEGYDVVSGEGERISVKTTATMGLSGHVSFNSNSLELVDRVIVLRVNTEEMQIETLLNAPIEEALHLMSSARDGRRLSLPLGRLGRREKPHRSLKILRQINVEGFTVRELENGSIEVMQAGTRVVPAKPTLRKLARRHNLSLLNSRGNPLNTRQLGSWILRSLSDAGV